jgi:F-type H+-transporting ATPase subunit b
VKRLICFLALSAALSLYGAESEGHGGGHAALDGWKWANFLLLAGLLFWAGRKSAAAFFTGRSIQIRKSLVEAEEIRADAERRAAEVDRRLASLGAEIEALRREAATEQEAQAERARREMAAELAKVQLHAEQEIAAAGKQARLELKRYSAELALELAEKKIAARMNPPAQDALVDSFVRQLDGSARAQSI